MACFICILQVDLKTLQSASCRLSRKNGHVQLSWALLGMEKSSLFPCLFSFIRLGQKTFFSERCPADFIAFSPLGFPGAQLPSVKRPVTSDAFLEPNNAPSSLFLVSHVFKIKTSQQGESFCLCYFALAFGYLQFVS